MASAHGMYKPNAFPDGTFHTMLRRLAAGWGGSFENLKLNAVYTYGTATDDKHITLEETESITGIAPPLDSLRIYCDNKTDDKHVMRSASFYRSEFNTVKINISAEDIISAENLLRQVVSTLKLTEFDISEIQFSDDVLAERLEEVESRVATLEREATHPQLKCFLSFRFSNPSSAIAREIEQFLALLDVKVISGIDYEPRKVEDKVRDRLLSGVDFVVYLVTSDGESYWLRDELATATAQGAIPIPLVEDGCMLAEGLHGNIEYITFAPDHPGDAWVRLTQAVRYVAKIRLSEKEKKQQQIDNNTGSVDNETS